MCVANLFGDNGARDAAARAAATAEQQRKDAAAAVAQANMDTESSRGASENRLRKAAAAQGFASTVLGGAGVAAPGAVHTLYGQ